MDPVEITLGIGLAVLLVVVAVYFAFRQRQTFRQLRSDTTLSLDDRRYLYKQAVRRTASSALLFLLAGFIVGWFFLEPALEELRPAGPVAELPESSKESLRLLTYYWIVALLVFLAVVLLAVYDLFATARFGARHHRQLEDARRAALQAEVERIRRERRGRNGDGQI